MARVHRPAGADLVILPGGFAYGDYLRAGALARFSPVMGAVRDHAARGGLLLGICNGFQVLAEAGLVPGALLRNASLRFEHRWVRLSVERHDTPFTRGHPGGYHAADAHRPRRGQLLPARRATSTRWRRAAAWCSGTPRPEGNPNGSARDIAGVVDERGTTCGLMPHPERAAEAHPGLRRRHAPVPLAGRERRCQHDAPCRRGGRVSATAATAAPACPSIARWA